MPVILVLWKAKVGGSLEPGCLRQAWATWKTLSLPKIKEKISLAWWHMPVIPATWEAEAGELLELRRQRLQ